MISRATFAFLLCAPPAIAVTVSPSDVSFMDPIGEGCVDGGGYDDPFPAAKGVRAPVFCLPDPCEAALTRTALALDIVGREVRDWEWDAYYSRYAETCRAETILELPEPRPDDPVAFWEPILRPPMAATLAAVRSVTGETSPPARGRTHGFPGGAGIADRWPFGAGRPPRTAPQPSDDPSRDVRPPKPPSDPPTDLPVVPLPLAGWLLLSSLGAVAALRRFG